MHEAHVRASKGIGLQVSEVSSMRLLAQGTTVAFVLGVEMLTIVGCWIAVLVYMNAVFAIRVQTLDWAYNLDWRLNGILAEGGKTHYRRPQRVKDANGVSPCIDFLRPVEQERGKC